MEYDSWLRRQFVVRKAFLIFRRIGDLKKYARYPNGFFAILIFDYDEWREKCCERGRITAD